MNEKEMINLSKRLARALRHDPASIGIELDPAGWTDVARLLAALRITRERLIEVVEQNDKKRYSFDKSGAKIRANQGHSVEVDLNLPNVDPPEFLYHGTVVAALDAIRREGLRPMQRHAVHLSVDEETARRVGARRGKPIILRVRAQDMVADGHQFQLSANGVWLTDSVPSRYLEDFPAAT